MERRWDPLVLWDDDPRAEVTQQARPGADTGEREERKESDGPGGAQNGFEVGT